MQPPCPTPEYAAQRLPIWGCLLNPLKRQSSSLSAQAGYSQSAQAHTKPVPWPRFKNSVPCTGREGDSFTRAVTLGRTPAFLDLSSPAKQLAGLGRWVFCSWICSSSLHKHDIEKPQSVMYFFFPMGHARKTTPAQNGGTSRLATSAQIFVMAGKRIHVLIGILMHKKQSCG